ncbi:Chromatin structure-remodeling complex subunit rsc1 [Grifola frondosa]|uniref:Chromatin structure-remodeling complex subunit rsc1 n=1 Tax=Grifola frondosa TaxID=5627 RepID=A0A1C7MPV9_GRIFR|nr:Chromatin structure-remodeling complex subunit rsc1 [Grifola frondosa]
MAVTAAQKSAIEEVIKALLNATSRRVKRRLAEMFLELVDKESWPEYYEVIPQPRCINGVKTNVEKNKYKDPLDVYNDLNLVFLNALYYNEEGSQIAKDATTLKGMLDHEWKQRSILPAPRVSPPPSSPQKAHAQKEPISAPEPSSSQSKTPSTQPKVHPATETAKPALPAAPATPPSTHRTQTVLLTSPDRPPSPELDVDIGGTPEPEGVAFETARDGEGDDIVRQLEKGLPRWEGFADIGWAEDIDDNRKLEIVLAISGHKDSHGNRLAATLEAMPEETSIPDLSFTSPLSLALIESRARSHYYTSSKTFDKEMSQLFLKGRRWFEPGTEPYGNVLVLQRLYHALTSSSPPPGPPYTSTTNFAYLRAGPGTAKPMHAADSEGVPGVTTFRVSTKDRTIVDEVQFKGWSVKLADWLHLSNPDDPSRPIVAQVFKCFISDEPSKKGQPGVTACWYYRPEQTFHPAQRQFWEKEVFKTSHFADHPLEDIIEKIACQFTARHIRGRPRPPFWYPGWPLYVCDSRYNDRERIFVKIKNWNSCVPEEVRKSTEFMPIYPFERPVFPRRFASPFISGKGVKGPGGIGDVIEKGEGEKIEGGGTGRRRPKRNAAGMPVVAPSRSEHTDRVGPSKGLYVGPLTAAPPAMSSPYPYQVQYGYPRPQSSQPRPSGDRSIVTAAGGLASLGSNASVDKLPSETARHFDRDPRPTSLKYLHFLAEKRKKADSGMDVDEQSPAKRPKVQRTVTEIVDSMMADYGVDSAS